MRTINGSGASLKRMRVRIALVSAAVCALSFFAYAGPGGTLQAGSASGNPGTSVNLSIDFSAGGTGVSSLNFDVPLPASVTYVSTSTGAAASAAGKSASGNFVAGSVRVVVFGLNQTAIGSGNVAVITLNIGGSASPGTYSMPVSGISASDPAGNPVVVDGAAGSITVNGTAPPAPTNLNPANGANSVSTTPTLTWSASSGATSYDVYFGTSSTPPLASNTTSTSYATPTLNANTVYYWRVAAKNGAGSNASGVYSFTTAGTAPAAPGGLNPANGATNVSMHPTLSWSASSGASSYDVYFGTSAAPPLATNTSGTGYAPSGLTANTTYYWRVVAKNSFGSNSSSTLSFTTFGTAPAAPGNLSPADGATGISTNPTLTWSASAGADSYDVYFGTSATPPLAANTTGTSHVPATLTANTAYYWRIVAKNSVGSNSSPTVEFTTGAADPAPPAPTNLSPANGSTDQPINTVLSWSASPGATSYTVYFGSTEPPALANNQSGTSYAPSGLQSNHTYYWRVEARNNSGSNSSAVVTFTTGTASAPVAPDNLKPADGSTSVSLTPTLSWSSVSGATSYRVFFGTADPPQYAAETGTNSFYPGRLEQHIRYYWRVVAVSELGTKSSATVSFTIERRLKIGLPRLASSHRRALSTNDEYTGVAIVNLDYADAELELTAYTEDGLLMAGDGITNPATMTLKPGEQLPIIDTQIFGDGLSESGNIAWMQIDSTSDKITSYFMEFDNALTTLDGAAVAAPMTSFLLAQLETRGSTRISIANPAGTAADLVIELIDGEGDILGTVSRKVKANGSLEETFTSLFPGMWPRGNHYLRVSSNQAVVPLEFLSRPTGDMEALSGIDAGRGNRILYAPQYAVGGGWTSSVSVINLDVFGGEVMLRFMGNDGRPIGSARTETIAPNGKIYIDAPDYFINTAGELTQGYLEIISSGPRLAGSMAFRGPGDASFAAALALVSSLNANLTFGHVASSDLFFMGIALLNPNDLAARVTIDVRAADGTLIGTTQDTIPAKGRACRLLTEYFPSLLGINQTSGYVKVSSERGIAAFALFGTHGLSSLAALPAQVTP